MEKIQVKASRNYEIIIGRDLLKDTAKYISQVMEPCKVCLISDDTVYRLYGEEVKNSLTASGFEFCSFIFEKGEKSKNIKTVSSALELMAENNFTRSDLIIALGGGITGDIAGFAASVFLRGIQFVQIPTTFLAAVDSSVGGKTGVNLESGKNLVGAFWQPSLVLCDCDTFSTLSYDIFLDGIAEALKYGAIIDRSLFDLLIQHGDRIFASSKQGQWDTCTDIITEVVKQCVSIKRDIVMKDERDTGIRQLLNFGHTIGHAIEKCSKYSITHGHGVALGMLIVSKASYAFGWSEVDCSEEIKQALDSFGFPLNSTFSPEELTAVALKDKKRTGESITLVVPAHIGHCYLKKIDISHLNTFINRGL